jgi:hypothetical protein
MSPAAATSACADGTNVSEAYPRSAPARRFRSDRIHEIFRRLRQDAPHRLSALSHFKRTKLFEFVARCMAIGDEQRIP